jgi:hypothetical protein
MTDLRVDLRWGAWPGGTDVILPLRKVGQREGDLVRSTSTGLSRSSISDDGGIVAGVDDKVIVSHSVLCFVSCVGKREELRREEGREEEERVQWGVGKPSLVFHPSYMAGQLNWGQSSDRFARSTKR